MCSHPGSIPIVSNFLIKNNLELLLVTMFHNDTLALADAFLTLLRDLGTAYSASQSFDVRKAIRVYESIPYQQYKTGWVLAEVGKAYLELSEYQKVS